jgi:hypothetical protein
MLTEEFIFIVTEGKGKKVGVEGQEERKVDEMEKGRSDSVFKFL